MGVIPAWPGNLEVSIPAFKESERQFLVVEVSEEMDWDWDLDLPFVLSLDMARVAIEVLFTSFFLFLFSTCPVAPNVLLQSDSTPKVSPAEKNSLLKDFLLTALPFK